MVNQQHINPATVKKASDDLHVFANQLTARLKKIKGEVESVTKAYTGRGSTAFQNSMTRWDASAVEARKAVFLLAGTVRRAGTEHVAGDERGIDGFNRAAGQYNGSLGG
jgi:WXG100 family type VII secretion target